MGTSIVIIINNTTQKQQVSLIEAMQSLYICMHVLDFNVFQCLMLVYGCITPTKIQATFPMLITRDIYIYIYIYIYIEFKA